jgi:hypothetical protein
VFISDQQVLVSGVTQSVHVRSASAGRRSDAVFMSDQQVLVAEVTRSAHVRSASAAPADQDQT